jgi:hypothetical protein
MLLYDVRWCLSLIHHQGLLLSTQGHSLGKKIENWHLSPIFSGADRVLEETVTRHTSCSKSSRHWPFIYSFISVDKCANDAEHHLRADALQPGTAAKVSSFFFLFASLTLTWERDLVFFAPARPPAGRDSIRSTRIPSCLAGAWVVSYANLHANQPFKV